MGIKDLPDKKDKISAIYIRGNDKRMFLLLFFIPTIPLAIAALFIKNEYTLGIFTIISSLSFVQTLGTILLDIKPKKKNYLIIIFAVVIATLAMALAISLSSWTATWHAIKWTSDLAEPMPGKFMLSFSFPALLLAATMFLKSSFTQKFKITPNEIELVRGTISFSTQTIGDNVQVKVKVEDLQEFLSILFSATIIIERANDDGTTTELMRCENVFFAHLKALEINKILNMKVVRIMN